MDEKFAAKNIHCNIVTFHGQNMAIFRFFKMAAAAILDFRNYTFLTVGHVMIVDRHAKFRGDRSNRGRNMAIFRFLKMAAAAILEIQNYKFLTVGRSKGSNYVTMPNFVKIARNAAEINVSFNIMLV